MATNQKLTQSQLQTTFAGNGDTSLSDGTQPNPTLLDILAGYASLGDDPITNDQFNIIQAIQSSKYIGTRLGALPANQENILQDNITNLNDIVAGGFYSFRTVDNAGNPIADVTNSPFTGKNYSLMHISRNEFDNVSPNLGGNIKQTTQFAFSQDNICLVRSGNFNGSQVVYSGWQSLVNASYDALADTVVERNNDGAIKASNLNEDYWHPDISYKFGQKVITRGTKADGKPYQKIWVNVKDDGDNLNIDPEGTNGSNLKNTNYVDSQQNGQYDWFNENWREEDAQVIFTHKTFTSFYADGVFKPSGKLIELWGSVNATGATTFSQTIVEWKDLVDQYGHTPELIGSSNDEIFSTTSDTNNLSRELRMNVTHFGDIEDVNFISLFIQTNNKKSFGIKTDYNLGAIGQFSINSFYWTDKVRNL